VGLPVQLRWPGCRRDLHRLAKDRCGPDAVDPSSEPKKSKRQPPIDVRLTRFARLGILAVISIRLLDQLGLSKVDAYLDIIERRLRAELTV
jgi:hypothetical protein